MQRSDVRAPIRSSSEKRLHVADINNGQQDIYTYNPQNRISLPIATPSGFQNGMMHPPQMQGPAQDLFNQPYTSRHYPQAHGNEPIVRSMPRHTPLDGESAFMAPGVNSGTFSNDGPDLHSSGSLHNGAKSQPHDKPVVCAPQGPAQPLQLHDVLGGYEPSPLYNSGLMSRFTSMSAQLMESSCELQGEHRKDTLMNMIDKMPVLPMSSAAAAQHASVTDAFDSVGMMHGMMKRHGPVSAISNEEGLHVSRGAHPVTTGSTFGQGPRKL